MRQQRLDRRTTARLVGLVMLFAGTTCVRPSDIATAIESRAEGFSQMTGSNVIAGRAFLVLPYDEHVRTCEDDGVSLIPASAAAEKWVRLVFGSSEGGYARRRVYENFPESELVSHSTRHAPCDASGHFNFDHVSDGKYFVVAKITWLLHWARSGGALMQAVEVKNGEQKNVVLEQHLKT